MWKLVSQQGISILLSWLVVCAWSRGLSRLDPFLAVCMTPFMTVKSLLLLDIRDLFCWRRNRWTPLLVGRASVAILDDVGFLRGASRRWLEELEGDVHVLGRGSSGVRRLPQGEDGLGGGYGAGGGGLVVEGRLSALARQTVLVFLGGGKGTEGVNEGLGLLITTPFAFLWMLSHPYNIQHSIDGYHT